VSEKGQTFAFRGEGAKVWNRRNLAIGARVYERPESHPEPSILWLAGRVRRILLVRHETAHPALFPAYRGNVPPGLLNAPDGWNVEQIRQFQEWFDSVLAGNPASRSRLVWGPAGTKYQPFKEAPLKDEFDEWLARIVCYAFSLPSTAFTRQVNRATAETAQEAALAEGLAPLMGHVEPLARRVGASSASPTM
jgi:hypothetical protein